MGRQPIKGEIGLERGLFSLTSMFKGTDVKSNVISSVIRVKDELGKPKSQLSCASGQRIRTVTPWSPFLKGRERSVRAV